MKPVSSLCGVVVLSSILVTASARPAVAQSHFWGLNSSYSDLYGGPSLVPDGGALGATGYTFGANQGLSVTGVFSGGVYSVAFRSYVDQTSNSSSGWVKLLDYSNRASDAGYYIFNGQANLYPTSYSSTVLYTPGTFATTVLTRNAIKHMQVFVDGNLIFDFDDLSDYYAFTGNIARFFEDDFAVGPHESSSGFVDWIATYDVALDPGDIPDITPPGSTVPEPASIGLLASGLAAVFAARRRRR